MSEPTVVAAFVANLARVALASGTSRARLEERTGLNEAALLDPDARVPFGQLLAIWELLSEKEGFDQLGVTLGSNSMHTEMGVLGWMLSQCATLRDVAATMERYRELLSDAFAPRFEVQGTLAVWTQTLEPRYVRLRQPQELGLVAHVTTCRALTGMALPVRIAEAQHPAPAGPDLLSETLGVKVRYGAPAGVIAFDVACLDTPVRSATPALRAYFERVAESRLAQLPRDASGVADRVRRQLVTTLAREAPSQSGVARALAMSERTLQRRLAEESTTFAALLDETRRELALLHLQERTLAIYEVALLLGYTEPSSFHRAFRRWTGKTPRAFREVAA